MGHKKFPFDRVLTKIAVGTTDDIVSTPVPDGQLFCIQRTVIENETNLITEVRIFKSEPAVDYLVAEHDLLSAGVPYTYDEPFYLTPRQYLKARCLGATANDSLKVTISGWWQELSGAGEV